MASMKSRKILVISILCFQSVLIILFSIFVKYDANADPFAIPYVGNFTFVDVQYPVFQDIHVMIFVGFGFLMTFLRKYAFSALGLTFLISTLVIQWALLCHGFFRMNSADELIHLSMSSIINADIAVATVLISLGAVLGKISPIQLIVMAILETIFFTCNEYLGTEVINATDPGGSMYVHVFGAYFGLAMSFTLPRSVSTQEEKNFYESSTYLSDINAMIGTLFLWVFWPSFNGALLYGDEKYRAILNTYLSLTASCLTAFAISSVLNKDAKFNMVHIQNATLAGGVCVGASANMMIQPYGALIIGSLGGILATLGFQILQEKILQKLRIHDTCGVNNLHGMPGITAGIIAAIAASIADVGTYDESLYEVFPAMDLPSQRTALQQAGYQLLALVSTLVISILSGIITGIGIRNFKKVEKNFDDDSMWILPQEDGTGTFFRLKI